MRGGRKPHPLQTTLRHSGHSLLIRGRQLDQQGPTKDQPASVRMLQLALSLNRRGDGQPHHMSLVCAIGRFSGQIHLGKCG